MGLKMIAGRDIIPFPIRCSNAMLLNEAAESDAPKSPVGTEVRMVIPTGM
jgi:hypothetical protein